jgi:sulfite exporter TauE/SafE
MDYWLSFLTGLFGSMHCVGMCGPVVLSYSTQGSVRSSSISSSLSAHLIYNAGRVLSYTLVGGFLGGLHAGVALLHDVGFWFSLIAGVVMTLMGLSLLQLFPALALSATLSFDRMTRNVLFRAYRSLYRNLLSHRGLEAKFYLGLLTPLLPCGFLYAMLIKAASTATVVDGALTMLFFGLGIVPALVATGLAGNYFGDRLRAFGERVGAAMVLMMGVVLILRAFGVSLPGGGMHHH